MLLVSHVLRPCGRGLRVTSLLMGGTIARRSFQVALGYKSPLAVRGFASATAKKPKPRAAAKPKAKGKTATKSKSSAKAKAKPKAKAGSARATKTKAKKAVKAKAKKPVKKAAKKVAKKPAKKRVINPERQKLLQRRQLKKTALLHQEPKALPVTAYAVFMSNSLKGKSGVDVLKDQGKIMAETFKNFSPAERARLDETAAKNKALNASAYQAWVETHTVTDIIAANKARKYLERYHDMKIRPRTIHDERLPKRPSNSAWPYFMKAKRPADSANIAEDAKRLSAEWKALSEAEKKPFVDLAAAEWTKYQKAVDRAQL